MDQNTMILEKLTIIEQSIAEIKTLLTMSIKHTDHVKSNKTHLLRYTHNHSAPHTKDQVTIPQVNDEQFRLQSERMKTIVDKANQKLNPGMYSNMRTITGETQLGGKKGEKIIEAVLHDLGYIFTKASSQQPCDFRNVRLPSDDSESPGLFFDSKKTDSTKIVLNDSVPKKGMWYIVFSTKKQRCFAIHCNVFRRDPDVEACLEQYKRTIECLRYDYKKFGPFTAAARINLSLSVDSYIKDDSNILFT